MLGKRLLVLLMFVAVLSLPLGSALAQGGTITGYHSNDGNSWTQVDAITFNMDASVYVGLAVGDDVSRQTLQVPGDRLRIRQFATITVLEILRRRLLAA